ARTEQETQAGPSDSDGPRTLKVRGPSRARSGGIGLPDLLPLAGSQLVDQAVLVCLTSCRSQARSSSLRRCWSAGAPAARRPAARRSGLDRGHQLGETGLAVRGLVPVDAALGGGLVELAGGDLQGFAGGIGVPGGDGRADLADVGLELRLHRAVAQSCLLVRRSA